MGSFSTFFITVVFSDAPLGCGDRALRFKGDPKDADQLISTDDCLYGNSLVRLECGEDTGSA